MIRYKKPHLTFAQQLVQLIDRGMQCSDRFAAGNVLEYFGYRPAGKTVSREADMGFPSNWRSGRLRLGALQ